MPAAVDKSLIFDSVLEVWRSVGYEAASTRKIAEIAGIAEVTLYRRFETKEKLFVAAFRNEAQLLGSEDFEPSGNLEVDLTKVVLAYQGLMIKLGPIVLEVMGGQLNPSVRKTLRPIAGQGMVKLEAIVQKYQKLGKLRSAKSSDLLLGLIGPVLAETLLSQAGMNRGAKLDLKQHVKRFIMSNRS